MFMIGIAFCLSLLQLTVVQAQQPLSDKDKNTFSSIKFEQKLDHQLPLNTPFADETGNQVWLRDYFTDRPVILVMAYYECPMLCTLVLNGLLNTLKEMAFTVGDEFDVVVISIDPQETPSMAADKKDAYLTFYNRPNAGDGWHFLTGGKQQIEQVADAIGFHFIYDQRIDEYAHPSGLVILTPAGKIARYFYGIEFPPDDVRFGLVEASAGKIGSPVDQILIMCYHYDPDTGRYSPIITNILRIFGTATIFFIAIPIFVLLYKEHYGKSQGLEKKPRIQPVESR